MSDTNGAPRVGYVLRWDCARGFGFVRLHSERRGKREPDVYVNHSVLKGGRLLEGRAVKVITKDSSHGSGRVVAATVEGEGVQARGASTGQVIRWNEQKGYGFIRENTGAETFVHATDIGAGYQVKLGGTVYFDSVDKGHEAGMSAVRVTGPGVIRDGESLPAFFHDIGVEMDDGIYASLHTASVHSLDDLSYLKQKDLVRVGFGQEPCSRILGALQELANLARIGPQRDEPRRALEEGQERGRVTLWNPAKKFGLVQILRSKPKRGGGQRDETEELKVVWVSQQIIDGGSLEKGEVVLVKTEDAPHRTGRYVATECKGYGVTPRGALRGTVTSWDPERGYGFAEYAAADGAKEQVYLRFPRQSEQDVADPARTLACLVGEEVTFDTVERGGKKLNATNLGGAGVTTLEWFYKSAPRLPTGFYPSIAGRGRGDVAHAPFIPARKGAKGGHSVAPPPPFGRGGRGVGKGDCGEVFVGRGGRGLLTLTPMGLRGRGRGERS